MWQESHCIISFMNQTVIYVPNQESGCATSSIHMEHTKLLFSNSHSLKMNSLVWLKACLPLPETALTQTGIWTLSFLLMKSHPHHRYYVPQIFLKCSVLCTKALNSAWERLGPSELPEKTSTQQAGKQCRERSTTENAGNASQYYA